MALILLFSIGFGFLLKDSTDNPFEFTPFVRTDKFLTAFHMGSTDDLG